MVLVIYVFVCASIVAVAVIFVRAISRMGVVVKKGPNDDDSTKRYLLHLLSEAEYEMIILDDGNDMSASVYNDREVVGAVVKKLKEHPNFVVKCYFNSPDKTLFRESLTGLPQVKIRTGSQLLREGEEVHCKIIDGGKMGYLSKHEAGSSARRFKFVDCSNVSSRGLAAASKEYLGVHMRNFAMRFEGTAA